MMRAGTKNEAAARSAVMLTTRNARLTDWYGS